MNLATKDINKTNDPIEMQEVNRGYVAQNKLYKLSVAQEEFCDNPREWDNLGTMVCWHKRYALGDEHPFQTAEEFHNEINKDKRAVVLPLFLMDHSQLWMSTTSRHFSTVDPCGWDWGQVGYIYVSSEKIKKRIFRKKDHSESH